MAKSNTYLSFTVQAHRENKKYSQIKDYRPSFVFVFTYMYKVYTALKHTKMKRLHCCALKHIKIT